MPDQKKDKKQSTKASLAEVAKLAGVSPITVSRALSNPDVVREKTRIKVQKAIDKTGYVPNPFARNLRSSASSFLAVFVDNIQNNQFMNAVKGCTDALAEQNLRLLLSETGYSESSELEAIENVLPFQPAAMVFVGVVRSPIARNRLKGLDIPIVEMWDFTPDPLDILVGFSNTEGGRVMGRHFCEKDYTSIAYVGRTDGREGLRLTGFKEELLRGGRDVEFLLPFTETDEIKYGKTALENLLEEFPDCKAAFFATDMLAIGAIFECRRRGISIPDDLAIAGFGDINIAGLLSSPLTTVHVPDYKMGVRSGESVKARLNGNLSQNSVLFDLPLLVRATS